MTTRNIGRVWRWLICGQSPFESICGHQLFLFDCLVLTGYVFKWGKSSATKWHTQLSKPKDKSIGGFLIMPSMQTSPNEGEPFWAIPKQYGYQSTSNKCIKYATWEYPLRLRANLTYLHIFAARDILLVPQFISSLNQRGVTIWDQGGHHHMEAVYRWIHGHCLRSYKNHQNDSKLHPSHMF